MTKNRYWYLLAQVFDKHSTPLALSTSAAATAEPSSKLCPTATEVPACRLLTFAV